MKKIIAAVAIVCATVIANAATVQWKTGTGFKPDGSITAAKDTISIFVWDAGSASAYDAIALDSIWDTYGAEKVADIASKDPLASATTYSTTTGAAAKLDSGNSKTYYGIVLMTYDADKDGIVDMYAVNKAIGSVNDSGSATSPTNLSKFIGGGSSGTAVSWQTAAVPEPTSGLLLLLGMAGLALKRKRA